MPVKKSKRQSEIAFEHYYRLGPKRSLVRLEKELDVDFAILAEWAEVYGWEELIDKRDEDRERVLNREYRDRTLKIRHKLTAQIEALIAQMESCSLGLPFEIRSPSDMKQLADAYRSLVSANIQATSKGFEVKGSESPKTWSDLISQADVDSLVEDDG